MKLLHSLLIAMAGKTNNPMLNANISIILTEKIPNKNKSGSPGAIRDTKYIEANAMERFRYVVELTIKKYVKLTTIHPISIVALGDDIASLRNCFIPTMSIAC